MREIILVGPLPPPFAGQSVSFQMLVEEVKKHGCAYAVVDLSGIKVRKGGAVTFGRTIEYVPILLDYFRKSLFREKTIYITIAQSRHGFFRDLIMISFARLKRHNIICHLKGGNYDNFYKSQPTWLRWLIRKSLLMADNLLILSERLRDMYTFEPRLKDKIHVVPNGLPFILHKPPKPKNLPEKKFKPIFILYLSNLIESKGYLDLLEAVRLLINESRTFVECHFCGEFLSNKADDVRVQNAVHGRELFENYVAIHGMQKNIIYRGTLNGEEKIKALRKSHFFVLPTNYNNEGQPVSIIEAIAFGNVVISTNYRAIADMVVHRKTGFLVPYGQPEVIARVIADTIANPKMYSKMSKAALEHFQKHFTQEAHLSRIIPILQKDV